MEVIVASRAARPTASLLGGTLLGGASVAFGLAVAYLTLATPLVSRVAPPMSGSPSTGIVLGIWSFSLLLGGALVVAGTDRLALVVAAIRRGRRLMTPVMRVLRELPSDVVVALGIVPDDGPPIPELVVGQFGAAVVHELSSVEAPQPGEDGREDRIGRPWRSAADPLDRVAQDADRVRRWLGHADLDFVVRVHGALVTSDVTIARTPVCAVITDTQIPAWLAALPRQRTLTVGRRARILAMVRGAADGAGPVETGRSAGTGPTTSPGRRPGVGW